MLDDKLSVKYISEAGEKERRKKKRKEVFARQVKRGVDQMQVNYKYELLLLADIQMKE